MAFDHIVNMCSMPLKYYVFILQQFNEGPKTSLVTPQQQSKEETTDQCPEMAFVMNENQVDLNPMPSMVKPLTISSKLAKKRKRHQSLSGII